MEEKHVRWVNKGITFLFAGLFIYATIHLLLIGYDYWNNRQVLQDAQELFDQRDRNAIDKQSVSIEGQQKAFAPLQDLNSDIVGWIEIEGTSIDYPVLQAQDNEYYLRRNYKEEKNRAGSIFMDYRVRDVAEDRHTILYGHEMRDGSMFSGLSAFTDQAFFDEQYAFLFDTPEKSYQVEVFSVYYTTTDFYYIETEFNDQAHYSSFIDDIQGRSMFESAVEVNENDQIMTLSTCDASQAGKNGRFVVHGKLVEQTG
nr:class B sortase [Shouchella xiaoxiensis]